MDYLPNDDDRMTPSPLKLMDSMLLQKFKFDLPEFQEIEAADICSWNYNNQSLGKTLWKSKESSKSNLNKNAEALTLNAGIIMPEIESKNQKINALTHTNNPTIRESQIS